MPERPALPRRAAAEAMAAFALVFCVGGAAVAEAASHAELGLPAQAAVSGLAIMALIYAVGHLSGAHINPAVTIAFTLTRHFPRREALSYIGAQLCGAALAGLLLLAIWPSAPGNLGANSIGVSAVSALVVETVLSAFLMFVIMAVATDTRAVASGTWNDFWIWVVGPITGTALGGFAYQLIRAPSTPRKVDPA